MEEGKGNNRRNHARHVYIAQLDWYMETERKECGEPSCIYHAHKKGREEREHNELAE